MIGDMESFCDNVGDAAARPKVVVIPNLSRAGQKNFDKLAFLSRIQTGLGTGVWFGFQGIHASFLHSPTPPLCRRYRNAKDFHNLTVVPAFQD
jgi:hypothetical protein